MKQRVLVIGGGITGLATACDLADAGLAVELFEARQLGAMASRWTLGGVRQSGRDPAELQLARAAIEKWAEWGERLGGETGYRRKGNLRLARNSDEVEVIRRMVEAQSGLGLNLQFLQSIKEIREISPAIGEGVLAASFCPGDGHADPDLTIATLRAAATRRGVAIHEGSAVEAIETRNGRVTGIRVKGGIVEADAVVLACGTHAPAMLAPLGLVLPMAIKRVCVVQTVPAPRAFEQVFGVANADCAGRQERDGRFRFTTGIDDWNGDPAQWSEQALKPSVGEIGALIGRASAVLPVLADAGLDRVWGGLIDQTPDALPVLDAPRAVPGLVIGAGFSGHGFGIGPVSGEILASLVREEHPRFDLAPFRLDRFSPAAAFAPLTLHG